MEQPPAIVELAADTLTENVIDQPNVNTVGIARKVVDGQSEDVWSVRVSVTRKRPESQIPSSQVIPQRVVVDGRSIPTDVVEGGPFYPLALLSMADELPASAGEADSVYAARYRPAGYGCSVGHFKITAGTFGCLVTDNVTGATRILSNNHVFANANDAAVGDAILQPGVADGGTVANDTIARLSRFVPMIYGLDKMNIVDAAIATPTSSSLVTNQSVEGVMSPIGASHPAVGVLFAGDCSGTILACTAANVARELNVAFPGGHANPAEDMIVEKAGRTTGWTVNRVSAVGVSAVVSYGGPRLARFRDLFEVPSMGHGGDSGSVIVKGQMT